MSPPQITAIGSAPSALEVHSPERVSAAQGSESRRARRLEDEAPLALVRGAGALEREASPRIGLSHPLVCVLTARQFEAFLERERSLADRGTRRFSLLVLRRHPGGSKSRGSREALSQLARQACARLRSTDLVGRLDIDRVEILLADTEPNGAQVVAEWLERAEARLGLDLERTIYVYPSVAERGPDPRPDGPTGARTSRTTEKATSTLVAPVSNGSAVTNGKRVGAHSEVPPFATCSPSPRALALRPSGRWPTEDLWPLLERPTPPWKRFLDILFSLCALVVLLPLFALIALAIRLDSPGPVVFRQLRAGRGARPFVFYKFRSMIADAEERRAALEAQNEQDGPIFKIRADPRITRLGSLLRRWSLDELPQLWNVLKGDISLVGPRSPTFDEVDQYERWQRRRLSVTGGLTCIWQVSGRSQIPFRDWMRLDLRYVACRNLWLDLRLLALTLPAIVSGRGAC